MFALLEAVLKKLEDQLTFEDVILFVDFFFDVFDDVFEFLLRFEEENSGLREWYFLMVLLSRSLVELLAVLSFYICARFMISAHRWSFDRY